MFLEYNKVWFSHSLTNGSPGMQFSETYEHLAAPPGAEPGTHAEFGGVLAIRPAIPCHENQLVLLLGRSMRSFDLPETVFDCVRGVIGNNAVPDVYVMLHDGRVCYLDGRRLFPTSHALEDFFDDWQDDVYDNPPIEAVMTTSSLGIDGSPGVIDFNSYVYAGKYFPLDLFTTLE